MSSMVDARIPVLMTAGAPPAAVIAWLVADGAVAPAGLFEILVVGSGHAPGCACCQPRSGAADALRRLFLRRAKGEVTFFDCVVVLGGDASRRAVTDALAEDLFVSARFKAG